MIDYYKGLYNINLLLRIHGSALYKSSIVGLLSVSLFLLLNYKHEIPLILPITDDDLDHPYGVGVLVSSVGFLIVFRANYSYQRYWQGCSHVHVMLSKWGDVAMNSAVFAMQNTKWAGRKPRSFYDFDELNKCGLTRDRRRHNEDDGGSDERVLRSVFDCEKTTSGSDGGASEEQTQNTWNKVVESLSTKEEPPLRSSWSHQVPTQHASSDILSRLSANTSYFPSFLQPNENFAHRPNGKTPPLFLQELAHRTSLLTAVALTTLRNDVESHESLLDVYIPDSPLPEVDPDKLPKAERKSYQPGAFRRQFRYWSGVDRTPKNRMRYNSSRPLSVLGGVSDAEIYFLQRAKGSYAKTQLCWYWLSELIVRGHMDGTLGEVHAAILSRLFQNLSDGMLAYNNARKIMYIPFPFPHAQLSVFYTFILVPVIPFLMDQYTNVRWVGAILTFLAVTCLVGLHEVARELENPFRNVPNEVPICTMQAAFNEGLVVMFAGYNPDGFWDGEMWLGRARRGSCAPSNQEVTADNEEEDEEEAQPCNVRPHMQRFVSNRSFGLQMKEAGGLAGHGAKSGLLASLEVNHENEEDENEDEEEETCHVRPHMQRFVSNRSFGIQMKKASLSSSNGAKSGGLASLAESDSEETADKTESQLADELRALLSKQAKEIEELTRLLDENERCEEKL